MQRVETDFMRYTRHAGAWVDAFRVTWLGRNLMALLVAASITAIMATYVAITSTHPMLAAKQSTVVGLILVDMILILLLAVHICWRLVELWIAKRRGFVGTKLLSRILIMFGLVSITPTIIMTVFSAVFFNLGIQSWFDERVSTALSQSIKVAESYLQEHRANIKGDALAMANDLNRQALKLGRNPAFFKQTINTQASIRNLSDAIVFQRNMILVQTDLSISLALELEQLTPKVLSEADSGEVVILTDDESESVRALIKLNNFFDTYLIVGRPVDRNVLSFIEETRGSAFEYEKLRSAISELQIKFFIVFIGVALLLLLVAIWFGMGFATELVQPVSTLVSATNKVQAGDLSIRIPESTRPDEIGILIRAFNRMTGQLEKQHRELRATNEQIDARRRFIEAVLAGTSSGVIALDPNKNVTLVNRAATNFLWEPEYELHGRPFLELFPEAEEILRQVDAGPTKVVQNELILSRKGRKMTFLMRVVREISQTTGGEGYIITFDDISELQAAQRQAAWSDVARRIAHEIKNPLTPINLAAERLKRKYLDQITSDKENFEKYIQTIMRHVKDIGGIVEEFVNFSRMRTAELKKQNIVPVIQDVLFSHQTAYPSIHFTAALPDTLLLNIDEQLMSQLFTNLFKNAAESVQSAAPSSPQITVRALNATDHVDLIVEDNGTGFPADIMDRALEPYVTTREKGTGLGLAIVKRILDDHNASIRIQNLYDTKDHVTGASITLRFPLPR